MSVTFAHVSLENGVFGEDQGRLSKEKLLEAQFLGTVFNHYSIFMKKVSICSSRAPTKALSHLH